MPGSSTTPGRPSACVGALGHVAFRYTNSVGTRNQFSIAAQWLACTFPCRRFADILTDACARLGADVVRYSFIVVDLHHLLLAGLPAHSCRKRCRDGSDGSGDRHLGILDANSRYRHLRAAVRGIWAMRSASARRYRARYAPIAAISGLMPRMFITRVRL